MSRHLSLLPVAALVLGGCYDASDLGLVSADELLELAALHQSALSDEDVAMPGAIDWINDPASIEPDFVFGLDGLPTKATLIREPWSDSYWPENQGGISYRWQRREAFGRLLAPDEIAQMDPVDISKLSPAEKYDLFVGATDWPLTQRAVSQTSPDESGWTGYCHGWSPASLQFEEPRPVTVTNSDGVEIRFGSSDVKALLTYFAGEVIPSQYSTDVYPFAVSPRGIGGGCGSGRADQPQCHDVNPGALHVLLANQLGLRHAGFVMEVDPSHEKWNQPVFAYDSEILGRRAPSPGAAEGTVEEAVVATTVTWGQEIEPAWEPVVGTHHQDTTARRYLYTLELDAAGTIVGGQWLARTHSGDFVTMAAAWDFLMARDADGDGQPDLTRDAASVHIFQWFPIPDFAWVQDDGVLPTEFAPVHSYWGLIGGGTTTRRNLYSYFGRLHELL
jgi:hypothetical protein